MGRAYITIAPAVRLWAKVAKGSPDQCWPWLGKPCDTGYGRIEVDGRTEYAHRYAYMLTKGPIPPGFEIDHTCRNRLCCNPDHLEAVVRLTNFLRGSHPSAVAHMTQVCKRGHSVTGENVMRVSTRANKRICRACHEIRRQRSKARHALP